MKCIIRDIFFLTRNMLNALAKQVAFVFHTIGPTSEKRYLAFGHQFAVSFASLALYALHFSAKRGAEASVRKQTENARCLKVGLASHLTRHYSSIMLNPWVLAL